MKILDYKSFKQLMGVMQMTQEQDPSRDKSLSELYNQYLSLNNEQRQELVTQDIKAALRKLCRDLDITVT